jgi:hypothetical protein
MTQITANPITVIMRQSEHPISFAAIRQMAAMIAAIPVEDQGAFLFVLFDALRRAGVDVELMGCVLAEVD